MNTNVRLGVVALLMLAMLCVPDPADLAPDRPDVSRRRSRPARKRWTWVAVDDRPEHAAADRGAPGQARPALGRAGHRLAEATGIAVPLQGVTPPRPLTHGSVLTLFGRLKVTLTRV